MITRESKKVNRMEEEERREEEGERTRRKNEERERELKRAGLSVCTLGSERKKKAERVRQQQHEQSFEDADTTNHTSSTLPFPFSNPFSCLPLAAQHSLLLPFVRRRSTQDGMILQRLHCSRLRTPCSSLTCTHTCTFTHTHTAAGLGPFLVVVSGSLLVLLRPVLSRIRMSGYVYVCRAGREKGKSNLQLGFNSFSAKGG